MVVISEETGQILLHSAETKQLQEIITEMKNSRKEKAEILARKVDQFEKKRLAEERSYRSLSPFRKLLVGRRPDHHLAVEYMVYVKQPLQKIEELNTQIRRLELLETQLNNTSQEQLFIPISIVDELLTLHKQQEER